MPHVQGISERIQTACCKLIIRTIHKSSGTLRKLLTRVKIKTPEDCDASLDSKIKYNYAKTWAYLYSYHTALCCTHSGNYGVILPQLNMTTELVALSSNQNMPSDARLAVVDEHVKPKLPDAYCLALQ